MMINNIRKFIFLFVFITLIPFSVYSAPQYSELAIDGKTGKVLYAVNADKIRYPASFTKLIVLYIIFEDLEKGKITLDTQIPVSLYASSQPPTKLGVKEGEMISVETAIRALIVKSANDVAVAVAEYMGRGSEQNFVKRMNITAKNLGMKKSNFANPSGLYDSKQVTTAFDMAILARSFYEHFPQYYHYFSYGQLTWNAKAFDTTNPLLGTVKGVDGLKTGYVSRSGFNLITSAGRDNNRVITVVMGGKSSQLRDIAAKNLVEQAFATLEGKNTVAVASKTSSNNSKNVSKTAKKPNSTSARNSTIQIGAFKQKAQAEKTAKATLYKNSVILEGGKIVVSERANLFSSRISGLTKEQAKNACNTLKEAGNDCFVIN